MKKMKRKGRTAAALFFLFTALIFCALPQGVGRVSRIKKSAPLTQPPQSSLRLRL